MKTVQSGILKWRQIGHNWELTVSISVGTNFLIILDSGPQHKVIDVKSVCLYKEPKLENAGYYILRLFMLSSLNWLLAKVPGKLNACWCSDPVQLMCRHLCPLI